MDSSQEQEYLFVFLTAPDCPVLVEAVFRVDQKAEALGFCAEGCFFTLRKAKWKMGKLPFYSETEKF
ncbi:MAG: hypothetical protein EBS53_00535 [Bacteroidetes bacterium]|jgi:hypothetical protein|nr:hypothetical protein [Bacteroidota bacterium]